MYALAKNLADPLVVALLFTWAALVWRIVKSPGSRRGWLWLAVPLACLTLCLTPAIAHLALGSLEWQYADVADAPRAGDAIVVLASGLRVLDDAGREILLDECGLQRTLYGARLYHRAGRCQILVTGGTLDPDRPQPPVSRAMADFLVELGVASEDIVVEDRSLTTHENALYSAKLLAELQPQRVYLVTDAFHMMRSVRCFQHEGVPVVPAPCNRQAVRFEWSLDALLPTPDAGHALHQAWHEWLGLLWYCLRGRV